MKFLKEQTRNQKSKALNESIGKFEDFIFEQISTYLDNLDVFLDFLEIYTNEREKILQSNSFNNREFGRNEELGKYLLHSLKIISIIQGDACDRIDAVN